MRKKKKRRLEEQPGRSLKKNLKTLPKPCDVGTKKNSKGYKESWIGCKLHLDVADGDIPISGILTSASLHDSQAAIPLAQMTAERVTSLYDLMDAAYDAPEIHAFSKRLGHVPIIDHNPRRGDKKQMDPPEKSRYKERSAAERGFRKINHCKDMIKLALILGSFSPPPPEEGEKASPSSSALDPKPATEYKT